MQYIVFLSEIWEFITNCFERMLWFWNTYIVLLHYSYKYYTTFWPFQIKKCYVISWLQGHAAVKIPSHEKLTKRTMVYIMCVHVTSSQRLAWSGKSRRRRRQQYYRLCICTIKKNIIKNEQILTSINVTNDLLTQEKLHKKHIEK